MTRSEAVVVMANAACTLVGFAFAKDEQVERAFAMWRQKGSPKGAMVVLEWKDGREIERVEPAP